MIQGNSYCNSYLFDTNLLLNGSSSSDPGRINALDGFWNVPTNNTKGIMGTKESNSCKFF